MTLNIAVLLGRRIHGKGAGIAGPEVAPSLFNSCCRKTGVFATPGSVGAIFHPPGSVAAAKRRAAAGAYERAPGEEREY